MDGVEAHTISQPRKHTITPGYYRERDMFPSPGCCNKMSPPLYGHLVEENEIALLIHFGMKMLFEKSYVSTHLRISSTVGSGLWVFPDTEFLGQERFAVNRSTFVVTPCQKTRTNLLSPWLHRGHDSQAGTEPLISTCMNSNLNPPEGIGAINTNTTQH